MKDLFAIDQLWVQSILVCLCFTPLRGRSSNYEGSTNRSCKTKPTCEELVKLENAADEIYWHACNCDRFCANYGDCCANSTLYAEMHLDRTSPSPYRCIQMDQGGTGILMKATCPPDWKGTVTEDLCKAQATNLNFPSLIISPYTGVVYPNKNCAICNNDFFDRLIFSTLRLKCPGESFAPLFAKTEWRLFEDMTFIWNPEITLWKVIFLETNHSCVANLRIPVLFLKFVRRCDDKAKYECPDNSTNWEIREKCKSYTYLTYAGGNVYRNPHCALCNGEFAQNLSCSKNYFINNGRQLESYKYNEYVNSSEIYHGESEFYVYLEINVVDLVANIQLPNDSVEYEEAYTFHIIKVEHETQGSVVFLGLILSNVLLFLHVISYTLIPNLRDLNGTNLASLCVAIFLGNLSSLLSMTGEIEEKACNFWALLTCYGYLASLFWIQTIAFDIWHMLKLTRAFRLIPGRQRKRFLLYSIWSWLAPACYTYTATVFHATPTTDDLKYRSFLKVLICWVQSTSSLLIFFGTPVVLILISNLILFSHSAYILYGSAMRRTHNIACISIKGEFTTYARLAVVMGVTWITALIASYFLAEFMWYAFIGLNSLQGLFIFLAFTCSEKSRIGFKKIFSCKNGSELNCWKRPSRNVDRGFTRANEPRETQF